MQPEVGATIRNFQTRKLLPYRDFEKQPITEQDMNELLVNIKTMSLLGLVSHFDESMVLFEKELHKYHPKIDLSYVAQNVNQDTDISIETRVQKLKDSIGEDVYNLLEKENHYDLMLYQAVEKNITRRINDDKNFAKKMRSFKLRCINKLNKSTSCKSKNYD